MSKTPTALDVWIVESKTVYQGVPFTVVSDWIQQGRLLDDDLVRPAGARADWVRIADLPSLKPYLPKPEPLRAEDRAEALEPVGLDMDWRQPRGDEDEDVDMIPLIDVSLVLLIFFMMTTMAASARETAKGVRVSPVQTPVVKNGITFENVRSVIIDVNLDRKSGEPRYTISHDQARPRDDSVNLAERKELLARLDEILDSVRREKERRKVDVLYNAHKDLEDGHVLDLLVELERRRDVIANIHTGVREATP
jgi:biopolymer transport protein ExbD